MVTTCSSRAELGFLLLDWKHLVILVLEQRLSLWLRLLSGRVIWTNMKSLKVCIRYYPAIQHRNGFVWISWRITSEFREEKNGLACPMDRPLPQEGSFHQVLTYLCIWFFFLSVICRLYYTLYLNIFRKSIPLFQNINVEKSSLLPLLISPPSVWANKIVQVKLFQMNFVTRGKNVITMFKENRHFPLIKNPVFHGRRRGGN